MPTGSIHFTYYNVVIQRDLRIWNPNDTNYLPTFEYKK